MSLYIIPINRQPTEAEKRAATHPELINTGSKIPGTSAGQNIVPTFYYKTVDDWKRAGSPNDDATHQVRIGNAPAGVSYAKPLPDNVIRVGVQGENPQEIVRTSEIKNLEKSNPKLYKILVNEGVENYNKAIDAENYVALEDKKLAERLKATTFELPDGKLINKTDLEQVRKEYPEAYRVLTEKGYDEYTRFVDSENKRIGTENARIAVLNANADKQNAAIAKLKPYTTQPWGAGPPAPGESSQVDVLAFIQKAADKKQAAQVLADAGYGEKDIEKWQKQAASPMYLNAAYQAAVREKRNELLKTVKLERFEDGASYAMRVDGLAQAEVLKTMTPEERAMITKERFVAAEGILVPGIETAAHWAYLSTPEKTIAVSLDVANVAVMLWGGKILSGAAKATGLSNIGKVERLAVKAGKAGQKLEKATAELTKTTTTADLSLNRVAVTERANIVEAAQRASMKADRLFLKKLESLGSVSSKDLVKLETKSGITGLKSSIQDVSRASKDLEAAWKYAERSKFYTEPKSAAQVEANNRHLLRLAEVQDAQARLDTVLARADSTLKPRYKQTVSDMPKFKGYQVKFKLDTSAEATQALGERLSKSEPIKPRPGVSGAKSKTAVQVVTAEDVGMSEKEFTQFVKERVNNPKLTPEEFKARTRGKTAEIKPVYETTPKPELPAKMKASEIPKVMPVDTMTILAKTPAKYEPGRKAEERVWTEHQREQLAKEEGHALPDVRSRNITEELAKTSAFTRLTPAEWTQVSELVKAGVDALNEAGAANKTREQIRERVKDAVNPRERIQQYPATQPLTKVQIKTIVDEILKTQEEPPREKTPKVPLRVPIKPVLGLPKQTSQQPSEKEKRAAIIAAGGAIAWPQGELSGKKVWHVIKAPYRPGDHLIVMGQAPEGAVAYNGPGEAYKGLRLLWGKGPSSPVSFEGGAIDPTISPERGDRRVTISFSQDVNNSPRRRGRPPKYSPPVERSEIGSGIVETHSGRRHARLH